MAMGSTLDNVPSIPLSSDDNHSPRPPHCRENCRPPIEGAGFRWRYQGAPHYYYAKQYASNGNKIYLNEFYVDNDNCGGCEYYVDCTSAPCFIPNSLFRCLDENGIEIEDNNMSCSQAYVSNGTWCSNSDGTDGECAEYYPDIYSDCTLDIVDTNSDGYYTLSDYKYQLCDSLSIGCPGNLMTCEEQGMIECWDGSCHLSSWLCPCEPTYTCWNGLLACDEAACPPTGLACTDPDAGNCDPICVQCGGDGTLNCTDDGSCYYMDRCHEPLAINWSGEYHTQHADTLRNNCVFENYTDIDDDNYEVFQFLHVFTMGGNSSWPGPVIRFSGNSDRIQLDGDNYDGTGTSQNLTEIYSCNTPDLKISPTTITMEDLNDGWIQHVHIHMVNVVRQLPIQTIVSMVDRIILGA